MGTDAFISYGSRDREWAESLFESLNDREIAAWFDARSTRPGAIWQSTIESAAREATILLVLVSPRREPSDLQQLEWRAALEASWADADKRFVVILLRKAELPTFVHSAVTSGAEIGIIRVDDPKREWPRAVEKIVGIVTGAKPLADTADFLLAATPDDRVRQRERLSYIKDAAKSFQDLESAAGTTPTP